MSHRFAAVLITALLSAPAVQAQSGIVHNQGLWEIDTSLITLSGGGFDVGQQETTQECIDTEEAATFYIQDLAPGDCTLKGFVNDATGASALMTCATEATMLEGRLDVRLFKGGDAFGARATLATLVEDYDGAAVMTTFYLFGRRLGDCTASE
ncbi:MAG TPA: DUF3617 family protein [Henriciella marina]|uniref:DUF3617 domain-containing protein n=1 Tax=Henriciella sp. TaxID=1968823 RepID=UPI00182FC19F|nr:DUF3617 family protein [Henriciella sp.]HIG20935.1 DUF3617 family protein [Henriciella sp.]HIK64350.1 DUF3617 family protein [Henriciella marina]